MIDYDTLVTSVEMALREVSRYAPGKIEQVLEESRNTIDVETLDSWRRLTMDTCYDRTICRLLDVDYNNLPPKDIKKIKVFAIKLTEQNPDMVLPLLK